MPPRKRTEPKPVEPEQTLVDAPQDPSADPTDESDDTISDPNDEPHAASADPAPTKSDLQAVEQPCTTCFPTGWPDGAFSVGCEHGTWMRDGV